MGENVVATVLDRGPAVAIVTYRRPKLLQQAVTGVLQEFAALPAGARLIVVDNDPDESAWAVVREFAGQPVDYVAEPTIGIAAARNAALDAVSDHRLLMFIDDDETPQRGWLAAAVLAWRTWGCDAVAGPTVRPLDDSADPWVVASGFFDTVPKVHGARVAGASTSNLLLDLETVRRLGLRFDDRFGTTGGEDTLFTRRLTALGGIIRWCQDAATIEPVPPERASRSWVLARERRTSSTWSRVHLVLAEDIVSTTTAIARLVGTAAKLLATGSLKWMIGAARRELPTRAHGEREVVRAVGVLAGLFGARVEEYRRR